MNHSRFDVVAIGNAIMDVLAYVDDAFLTTHALRKGTMRLIDVDQADYLYNNMQSTIEYSGGSAANTAVGLAALGGQAAFIGKVADDPLGRAFSDEINSCGVHFTTSLLQGGPSTAYCLVLVTPDAQRTMNTYLGACLTLQPDDIDLDLVQSAQITYLEGYQWDLPRAKEVMQRAAQAALASGGKVALSLSDCLCVDRHRAEFLDWVRYHIDILFANEIEIMSLYQVSTFDEALRAAREYGTTVALTRGEKGSVIATTDSVHVICAEPVTSIVDTTGAGDLFAAGFLYGLTRDRPAALCARLGSLCAAEVISHFGVRPIQSLVDLAKMRLPELRDLSW